MAIKLPSKKKDPSKTSSAHDLMASRIKLVNTLMAGTEELRIAGETYLPRHEGEAQKAYDERLKRSVLVNYFRRSIESLVGKPFSNPLVLGDDMPQQLKDISEDIDHQGNNIDVFARRVFQDGLTKGLSHILVEYPNVVAEGATTLEQERAINATPYFIHVPPESILAAYCEYRNGQEVLTHVRIYETETVREGFEEYSIERVRVLEPGTWTVWRKYEKRWDVESSGATTLNYIPLITFYADREDFMIARPPLEDLAYVNIAHYQSDSDQRNILTVARFPMLAGSGLNEEEAKTKIGPRQLLTTVSKDGKFYYVEHTGAAIDSGRTDLKDMEEQMSILGIELLKKSGNPTATAKAIDTAENLSMLQVTVLMFQDALERAYGIAAEWLSLGRDAGGTVNVNAEFGLSLDSSSDLTVLTQARTNREISHEQYCLEMQRRGTLSEDFDVTADKLLLDNEKEQDLVDQALQVKLQNEGVVPPPNANQ